MRNHKNKRQEKQKEKETEKNKAQTLKNIYFCNCQKSFLYFLKISIKIDLLQGIEDRDRNKKNKNIKKQKPQAPETRKIYF